jgi:hypothetical protein
VTAVVKRLIAPHRKLILEQVLAMRGLMQLLMKVRNTGTAWTPDELSRIRRHLREVVKLVPIVMVFILPGGLILLHILAEVLDRRTQLRD